MGLVTEPQHEVSVTQRTWGPALGYGPFGPRIVGATVRVSVIGAQEQGVLLSDP